jgi:imidazoleglycerol-phosphate dehydratase
VLDIPFTSGMIGGFDTQLTTSSSRASNHAGVTLHIDNLKGVNAHHQCETVFKAFARALRAAWSAIRAAQAPFPRPRVPSNFKPKGLQRLSKR